MNGIVKFMILIPMFPFLSCETKGKEKNSTPNTLKTISEEKRSFIVGDVDNDRIQDTAFVDSKQYNDYVTIQVAFANGITQLDFGQSYGVVIQKTEDLNDDGANEIIIFSRTPEGWWNSISVWSYRNNAWEEIQKTKGFITENEDFENRIIKEKNQYYLIGDDPWNEDEKGDFKKIRVKI